MTVVVTGATGHVGANLTRALLSQGRRVRALLHGDDQGSLDGLELERVSGDVCDPASLERVFAGADVVYHLAARISITDDDTAEVYKVNVEGTRNVVAACLKQRVRRLLHFSSVHAFSGLPADRPIDETRSSADVPGSLPYDRSKARGEAEVLAGVQRGLDAVIVNPGAIIGPHDYRPSPLGAALLMIAARRIPAVVQGGYNWVDVRDIVNGALAAEQRGRAGERYLLTGHRMKLPALSRLIAECTGERTPTLAVPMWLARGVAPMATVGARMLGKRPLFTSHSLAVLRSNDDFVHDKASRELNYQPRPLRETVTDTLAWYKANKYY